MASSSAPDQELKAAFAELQSKMVENKQKIKLHDLQIENLKRSITHSTLTDTEITQLPKDTKVCVNNTVYAAFSCKRDAIFRCMKALGECSCYQILEL